MANEKRLIYVNTMLKGIATFKRCYEENEKELSPMIVNVACRALSMVEKFVKETPTVDAVEVVRGHMVERIVDHECPWYKVYDCSECGCSVERWHNYCPNCGADMRERKDHGSA